MNVSDLGMSWKETVSYQKWKILIWHSTKKKCRLLRFAVWVVKHFFPRCAESMARPSLLPEDRADSSRASNYRWSPSWFQNPDVVNGILELHTCTGRECRADPHCRQKGSSELHLNVFEARRSRKGTERLLAGTDRKGKTGDEKKRCYLLHTVRSSFSTPFTSYSFSQPYQWTFSMNLTLMNEPATLVFLVALHIESMNSLPSRYFTLSEDHHNYSWSLKTTLQSQ